MQIEHLLCGTIHLHNGNALAHIMWSFHNLSTKDANLCITCSLIRSPQLANKENRERREERPKLLSFRAPIHSWVSQLFVKVGLLDSFSPREPSEWTKRLSSIFPIEKLIRGLINMPFLSDLSLNLTVNEGTSSVVATFWTQSAQTSSVQKYKELMIRKNLSLCFPGVFKVLSFCILSHPFVTFWFSKFFFFLFFHCPQILWSRFYWLCGKGA